MALVGTTASGKSAIAMEAARATGLVEIVSVDSMAVYRGMDLATAKPSITERSEIPHHLIDVLDPSEECSVSLFKDLANAAMADIAQRGRVPLLVGGTGLYHRAVIDDLEIPGQFPEIRERLEAEAATPEGLARLVALLEDADPVASARIEPGNVRRVARALEVIEGTDRPFSSFGPGLESYAASSTEQVGLVVDQPLIDERIEARVASWMDGGLLDEVRDLAARPEGLSRTARQAIGYRELLEVVEHGADLVEAVEATVSRTKSLARRQRSWFRRDPRIEWTDSATEATDRLVDLIERIAAGAEMGD